LFKELGLKPDIVVKAKGVGTFYLTENVLYVMREGGMNEFKYVYDPCVPGKVSVMSQTFNKQYYFEQIFDFVEGKANLPGVEELQLTEAQLLTGLFTSNFCKEFLTEYRNYRVKMMQASLASYALSLKEKLFTFVNSPKGKILLGVMGSILAIIGSYKIYTYFTSKAPHEENLTQQQNSFTAVIRKLLDFGQKNGIYTKNIVPSQKLIDFFLQKGFGTVVYIPSKELSHKFILEHNVEWYCMDLIGFFDVDKIDSESVLFTSDPEFAYLGARKVCLKPKGNECFRDRYEHEMFEEIDWDITVEYESLEEEDLEMRIFGSQVFQRRKRRPMYCTEEIPAYVPCRIEMPKLEKQQLITACIQRNVRSQGKKKGGRVSGDEYEPKEKVILRRPKEQKKAGSGAEDNEKKGTVVLKRQKGVPALKQEGNSFSKMTPQNVMSLPDINNHSYLKPLEANRSRVSKNTCFIFEAYSDKDVLYEAPSNPICYGLGLEGNRLITVHHALRYANMSGKTLYVARDEDPGKFMKLRPVKTFLNRDIVIMEIVPKAQSFANIKNLFISIKDLPVCFAAVWFRYGPGKTLESFTADVGSQIEPYRVSFDEHLHKLEKFGWCHFGELKGNVSYAGDCGLPYYFAPGTKTAGKIIGIHFAANESAASAPGCIFAMIFSEDLEEMSPQAYCDRTDGYDVNECEICDKKMSGVLKNNYRTSQAGTCWVSWSSKHQKSLSDFDECALNLKPFLEKVENGVIEINVGKTSGGSQPHHHIQFIENASPKEALKIDYIKPRTHWTRYDIEKHPDIGFEHKAPQYALDFSFDLDSFTKLGTFLERSMKATEFCIRGYYYKGKLYCTAYTTKGHKPEKKAKVVPEFKSQGKKKNLPEIDFTDVVFPNGKKARTPQRIANFISKVSENLQNGVPYDVPFKHNTDTLSVCGSFVSNQSPLPMNTYKPTPYSRILKTPNLKAPFNPFPDQGTEEQTKNLIVNNFGNKCPRSTQSVQFEHRTPAMNNDLYFHVRREYVQHVKTYYHGLAPLTDTQVLEGFDMAHPLHGTLNSLVVDTSAGWTLKKLFGKGRKDDYVSKDELGHVEFRDTKEGNF
jgi:hypothetical protein